MRLKFLYDYFLFNFLNLYRTLICLYGPYFLPFTIVEYTKKVFDKDRTETYTNQLCIYFSKLDKIDKILFLMFLSKIISNIKYKCKCIDFKSVNFLVINVVALIEVQLQGTLVEICSKNLWRDPIYTIADRKFNRNRQN